jgi:hypothetical protein
MSAGSSGACSRRYSTVISAPGSNLPVFSTVAKIVPVWPGASCQFFGSSIENMPGKTFGGSMLFGFA